MGGQPTPDFDALYLISALCYNSPLPCRKKTVFRRVAPHCTLANRVRFGRKQP